MNKKTSEFVEFVELLLEESHRECPENVRAYLDAIKEKGMAEKPPFTENGKIIIELFQGKPAGTMLTAKAAAEELNLTSRAVSGAMRKLVEDGFFEKLGNSPTVYTMTDKGRAIKIAEENA